MLCVPPWLGQSTKTDNVCCAAPLSPLSPALALDHFQIAQAASTASETNDGLAASRPAALALASTTFIQANRDPGAGDSRCCYRCWQRSHTASTRCNSHESAIRMSPRQCARHKRPLILAPIPTSGTCTHTNSTSASDAASHFPGPLTPSSTVPDANLKLLSTQTVPPHLFPSAPITLSGSPSPEPKTCPPAHRHSVADHLLHALAISYPARSVHCPLPPVPSSAPSRHSPWPVWSPVPNISVRAVFIPHCPSLLPLRTRTSSLHPAHIPRTTNRAQSAQPRGLPLWTWTRATAVATLFHRGQRCLVR
ncbi:hypothetical protein BCR44DRAFT_1058866 [Catenaria anguillulae PL171]|uniref:Uncharacterized protein n=1 Tax=Catenaria anguillulae PL171 TaxID=765915 RepID=A0A1Y2HQ61_9FUNG|nr:hypothetical protein BCR44DRAFT_1058866 [Catenaria anguillulae PL171]